MNTADEFNSLLKQTDVMQQVTMSMEQEPLKLLVDICRKREHNGRPVPDHNLHMQGYIGDIALKALIESGLVRKLDGGRMALYSFEPTASGLQYYSRLQAEKTV
ncbi:MAG TPA: hypothetical protein VJ488_03900 [Dehalococcoidia bacterium]|nr:hypothetical protein [Dehalococcoidia bacterium]